MRDLKQYHLTLHGAILRTNSKKVATSANETGWRLISRREYQRIQKAIRAREAE